MWNFPVLLLLQFYFFKPFFLVKKHWNKKSKKLCVMSFNQICLSYSSQLPSRSSSLALECTQGSTAAMVWQYLHSIPAVEDLPGDIQVSTFKPSSTPSLPSSPAVKPPFLSRLDYIGQTVAVVVQQGLHHVCYAMSRYPFTSWLYHILIPSYQTSLPLRPQSIPETVLL